MRIALLGIVSLAALAGCQSEDRARKLQVRDTLVAQCNQQVQMMSQSGLGGYEQLCTCIGSTIDALSDAQFKAMTTNPLQASQFSQTINAQCMQRIGPTMMGGGIQPGVGSGLGPGPYGGAAEGAGANVSRASNTSQ